MKKIALVTGGTGGIGTEICRGLLKDGYDVIALTLSSNKVSNFVEENPEIKVVSADVSDYESCKKAADEIRQKYGSVDVIVNNAGITRDCQFKKMEPSHWQSVLSVNLFSVFNVTHQFVNDMIEKGWGRIINISSVNGQKGQFGQTNYAAAKAGMHGFTMSLAQELARTGITVNTISPGYTGTPMVKAIREDILESIVNMIPMKRLAEPKEIAAAVSYLCSDGAAYISGANLPINGVQFTSF